jgi:hypothetical protein
MLGVAIDRVGTLSHRNVGGALMNHRIMQLMWPNDRSWPNPAGHTAFHRLTVYQSVGRLEPWADRLSSASSRRFLSYDNGGGALACSNVRLYYEEIQRFTHCLLGRFFIAFASVELNLSLRVGGEGKFYEKLDWFYQMAIAQHGDNDLRFCEISAWYMAADSMREIRNLFAHGRWGFLTHSQSIVHVSGFPLGPQDERTFSLAEFDAIV